MNIKIAYFSGTGCTEFVAETVANEFKARGHRVLFCNIRNINDNNEDFDLLIICFVVHACNAPEPVMEWVRNLEKVNNKPTVVISVSGGGEVTPNLACRVPLKKALKKKNYQLIYEKMLVMPSNWIVETKQKLCLKLLEILPYKVSFIVNDILIGNKNFTFPLPGNRILTMLGSLERIGAHSFGKNIKVEKTCNGCGKCVKQCPVSNITLKDNKPAFDKKCILCLNCIYSCPKKALTPTIMKFVVIKNGFSLKELLEKPFSNDEIDLDNEAKGIAWIGVKRYLSNTSDILEPMHKKRSNTGF